VANEMAGKTAELLMGARNPNHPDEDVVRREVIEQLRRERNELQEENAELRCASRELNHRLVEQARCIDAEKTRRIELEALVHRARLILKGAHLIGNRKHAKNFHALTMATPACPVCKVLVEMERSAR
jgi:DNA repair exonuclease SbcCD ATPase subunit